PPIWPAFRRCRCRPALLMACRWVCNCWHRGSMKRVCSMPRMPFSRPPTGTCNSRRALHDRQQAGIASMNWEAVIGLEIHIQLATTSKLFSPASTAYGAPPNAQACAGDLALPGTLPVVNANAIHMAVLFGLAVGADMPSQSVFERKHYFYPDLPPGYQISQLQAPVSVGGHVDIDTDSGTDKCIRIEHAHLEADAGKSLHENFGDHTGIDLNRAGTPLIECVSEADMRTPAEAVAYARKLHTLVQYLGICDGNMQEGSFRVDANVSVRPSADSDFGTRTETKNLNSFRFM